MIAGQNSPIGIDTVSLKELPDDAFRDVFLVVLAGCRAGNLVYAPQSKLRNLSRRLDPQSVRGILDEPTRSAIRAYQRWLELPITGTIDEVLLRSLGAHARGPYDAPPTVQAVQGMLTALSDLLQPDMNKKGEVTGVWGPSSQLAANTYQEKVRLPVTGQPDAATLSHMGLGAEDKIQENVAQTMIDKGAETVVAFDEYTYFDAMKQWSQHFWTMLNQNRAIGLAAEQAAKQVVLRRGEKMPLPMIFGSGTAHLQPARYGRGAQG